jgi:hypothetical protein
VTTINALAAEYIAKRETGGLFLEQSEVLQCFIDAARKYAAYGYLKSLSVGWYDTGDATLAQISGTTQVTTSEWGVIHRLAELYVERESAMRLEATRGLGADTYARTVSEVTQDITQFETELPRLAFLEPIVSVGLE